MMPCEQPGQGRPVCEPHQESQPSQHVCAIFGGALFGSFLALFKKDLDRPFENGLGSASTKSIQIKRKRPINFPSP